MHPTKFYVAPIVHKDTRCDECHATPIEGRRYKCLQCENYDLCAACYERVCHIPGHVFASLKKPTVGLPWAGSLLSGPVGPWGARRTSSVFGGGVPFPTPTPKFHFSIDLSKTEMCSVPGGATSATQARAAVPAFRPFPIGQKNQPDPSRSSVRLRDRPQGE